MIEKDDYYQKVDMAVYRDVVAPMLSGRILDIHAHARAEVPSGEYHRMQHKYPGRKLEPYPVEELLATAQLMWPGQSYHALVFGMPMPEMREASNAHVADECSRRENLYPLYIPDLRATEGEIRRTILEKGFYGFKPYWALVEGKTGEEEVTIPEMLPETCMRVAEELGLLVMIHIPGRKRLASERNIDDIRALSREYPGARIILAHLGRSYCPWSMKGGIDRLCNLPNVYWDTSVVQEATVFKIFFDQVDPAKVMYGTDLPIMQMRGRRVCINDAWVDVTRDPLGWTANRSPGNPIRGTFMTYEMVRAMREGAEAAGLSVESLKPVFFENGMSLIEAVKRSLASA